MSATIFTPITLWENFKYDLPVSEGIINEYDGENEITYKELYISGRRTERGQVAIYGLLAYDKRLKKLPGLLILPTYAKTVLKEAVTYYAKEGYLALMIDYGGNNGKNERYTKYPEDINYANQSSENGGVHIIETDVKNSCWYEWVSVARYAFYYLNNNPMTSGVGAIGNKHGATILWQLGALEPELKCMVTMFSAGWRAYRNAYKFAENPEPKFTEQDYKYLGGVEPQTYAQYVTCPTLMLTSTNNKFFDVDRAYDTIVRINEKIETAINYSVQRDRLLDAKAFADVNIFLGKYLKKAELEIPKSTDLTAEIVNGEILIKLKCDKKSAADIMLYASEGTLDPHKRVWNMLAEKFSETEDIITYKYLPYNSSKIAFFFAQITYVSGFTVCSKIIAKKFTTAEIFNNNKSNIIYSSKENKYLMQPVGVNFKDSANYYYQESNKIEVSSGAFGIQGITSNSGLKTLKINSECYKPDASSILMLNIYSKTDNELTVTLISEETAMEIEYSVTVSLPGGETWRSFNFPISKFKTKDGMILKSYDTVTAIIFNAANAYLLNNILWI